MNVPIISPWLIYLLGIAENLRHFMIAFGTVILVLAVMICIIRDSDGENIYRYVVVCMVGLFILIIGVLMPDKVTLTQMIIARNITPARMENVVATGKSIKDDLKKDVLDIIREINKEANK